MPHDIDEACTPEGSVKGQPKNSLGTPVQFNNEHCGHAVMQGMIRDATDGATYVEEGKLFPGQAGGSDADDFANELRRYGAEATIYDNADTTHVQQMLGRGEQVAVGIKTRQSGEHWVRIEAIEDGRVYFADPYNGNSYSLSVAEFENVMDPHGVVTAKWPNGVQVPATSVTTGTRITGGRTGPRVSVPLDESIVDFDFDDDNTKVTFGKGSGIPVTVIGTPTDTAPVDQANITINERRTDMIREGVAARDLGNREDVRELWYRSDVRRSDKGVLWGDEAETYVRTHTAPGATNTQSAPDLIAKGTDASGQKVVHMAEGKGTDLQKAMSQFEAGAAAASADGRGVGDLYIYGRDGGVAIVNRNAETKNLRVNPDTGIVETRAIDPVTNQTTGDWRPRLVAGKPVTFIEVEVFDPDQPTRTAVATPPRTGVRVVTPQTGGTRTPAADTPPVAGTGLSDMVDDTLKKMGVQNKVMVLRDQDGVRLRVFNEAGDLVHDIKYNPTSRSSVQKAAQLLRTGLRETTLPRIAAVLETAGRLIFLLDAVRTLGTISDPETRIALLEEYATVLQAAARAAETGNWPEAGVALANWSQKMASLGGPFATAGGGFWMWIQDHWLATYGADALSQLPAPYLMFLARKTQEVAKRLRAELNRSNATAQTTTGTPTTVAPTRGPQATGASTTNTATPVTEPRPVRRVSFTPAADYSGLSQADLDAAIASGAQNVAKLRADIRESDEWLAYIEPWEKRLLGELPTADDTNGSEFMRSDKEAIENELAYIARSRAIALRRKEEKTAELERSRTELTGLVTEHLNRGGLTDEGIVDHGAAAALQYPLPSTLSPQIAEKVVELATASKTGFSDQRQSLLKVGAAITLVVIGLFAGFQLFAAGDDTEERPESVLRFLETAVPGQPTASSGQALQATPTSVLSYALDSMPQLSMNGGERDAVSGPGSFSPVRNNVTDPGVAFSTLPVIPAAINEAGGQLIYNVDQATAPTQSGIFNRQNSVLWFANAEDARRVVDVMAANYPTAFQDYVTLQTPDGWQGYCFTGRFGSGPTPTYWAGCGLQRLNVIVASYFGSQRAFVGDSFLTGIAAYHARVLNAINAGAVPVQATAVPIATAVPGATALPTAVPVAATAAPGPTSAPAVGGGVATPTQVPNYGNQIVAALADYIVANRNADGGYIVAHLHPTATSFYGLAACQDFFSRLGTDPTFNIEVLSVRGPESWTWSIYGETPGTINDAYTLRVRLTQRGQVVEVEVHFAWDPQRGLLTFSPCRRPPGS
jgi:hypothetical protein